MPFTIYGVISCFVVLANSFDFWFGEIISGIGFRLEEWEIERRSVPSEISDNLRHFSRRTLVYVIKRPPPVRIDLAFWRMSEGGGGVPLNIILLKNPNDPDGLKYRRQTDKIISAPST